MDCSMPGFPVPHHLPEFAQGHFHWVDDAIQSSPLPSVFSSIRDFFNEPILCIRWPKYWSFSFKISSSNKYSGLISFKIDWFDLLAVQGTLKSLLQHYSLKASILWHSAFFMAQISHLLEKAMATHSSTLAWKPPRMEEPGGLQSLGSLWVRHNRATSLSLFTFMHWRRKWQPTPVFLPGESLERGSLVGCHLWGCTESDTTEAAQQQLTSVHDYWKNHGFDLWTFVSKVMSLLFNCLGLS